MAQNNNWIEAGQIQNLLASMAPTPDLAEKVKQEINQQLEKKGMLPEDNIQEQEEQQPGYDYFGDVYNNFQSQSENNDLVNKQTFTQDQQDVLFSVKMMKDIQHDGLKNWFVKNMTVQGVVNQIYGKPIAGSIAYNEKIGDEEFMFINGKKATEKDIKEAQGGYKFSDLLKPPSELEYTYSKIVSDDSIGFSDIYNNSTFFSDLTYQEQLEKQHEEIKKLQDNDEVKNALEIQKNLNQYGEELANINAQISNLENKENRTPEEDAKLNELKQKQQELQQKYIVYSYGFVVGKNELDNMIKEKGWTGTFQDIVTSENLTSQKNLTKYFQKIQNRANELLEPLQKIQEQNAKIQQAQFEKPEKILNNTLDIGFTKKGLVLPDEHIKEISYNIIGDFQEQKKKLAPDDYKSRLLLNVGENIVTNMTLSDIDKIIGEKADNNKLAQIKTLLGSQEFQQFKQVFMKKLLENPDEYLDDKGNINYRKIGNLVALDPDVRNSLAKYEQLKNTILDNVGLQEVREKKEEGGIAGLYYGAVEKLRKFKLYLKRESTPVFYNYINKISGGNKSIELRQYKSEVDKVVNQIYFKDPELAQDTLFRTYRFVKTNLVEEIKKNPFSALLDAGVFFLTLGGGFLGRIPGVGKIIKGLDESIDLIRNPLIRNTVRESFKVGENLFDDLPASLAIDSNVRVEPSFGWYIVPNIGLGVIQGIKLRDLGKLKRGVIDFVNNLEIDKNIVKTNDDLAKYIQGHLVDNGLGFVELNDIKNLLEESKGQLNRAFKIKLARKVDENLANFILKTDEEKIAQVNRWLVEEKINRGELVPEDITSIVDSLKGKYGEYIDNMRLMGKDDKEILINLLNLEKNTVNTLAKRSFIGFSTKILNKIGNMSLPEELEKNLKAIEDTINNADLPEEVAKELKASLVKLKSKVYTIQTLAYGDNGLEYLKDLQGDFDKLISDLKEKGVTVKVKLPTPEKIIPKNTDFDLEKVVAKMKTFDGEELGKYVNDLKETVAKNLSEEEIKNAEATLDIIKGIVDGTVKLKDLPENYRKGALELLGMVTQSQRGTEDLLYTMGLNLFSWWKKGEESLDIAKGIKKYISKLSDAFYFSLKNEIKDNLIKMLKEDIENEIKRVGEDLVNINFVKKYLPFISDDVAEKLVNDFKKGNYKKILKVVIEQSFIRVGLFNLDRLKEVEDISFELAKVGGEFVEIYKPVDKLVRNFFDGMGTINKLIEGEQITKTLSSLEDIKKLLGYAYYMKYSGKNVDIAKIIRKQTNAFVIAKNLDEEAKTILIGVDAYGTARVIPSYTYVVDMLKKGDKTVEEMAKILPVNYVRHPLIFKEITSRLDDKGKELLFKALDLAEKRHYNGLEKVLNSYDIEKGILKNDEELWKGLSSIDPNITRLNFTHKEKTLHFATQDLMKFIALYSPEEFKVVYKNFLEKLFKDLESFKIDISVFSEVAQKFTGKGGVDGYMAIMDEVKNKLKEVFAGLENGDEIVEDLMSRMYTDAAGYVRWITENGGDLAVVDKDDFFMGLARALISSNYKNAVEAKAYGFIEIYKDALEKIKLTDEEFEKLVSEDKRFGGLFHRSTIGNIVYNIAQAKMHYDFLFALKNSGVEGFKIPKDVLNIMLNKFTRERWKNVVGYLDTIIPFDKLAEAGIRPVLGTIVYSSTDVLSSYIDFLVKNEKEIKEIVGDMKYNKALIEAKALFEKGYTPDFGKYLEKKINGKLDSVTDKETLDEIFFDSIGSDGVFNDFIDNVNKRVSYNLAYDDIVVKENIFSPEFQKALKAIQNEFHDIQQIIVESKEGAVKFTKLFNKGYFKYLYEGTESPFKKVVLGAEGVRMVKVGGKVDLKQMEYYKLVYDDTPEHANNFMVKMLGKVSGLLTNLQTVTKFDPELADILDRSIRRQNFYIKFDHFSNIGDLFAKMGFDITKAKRIGAKKAIGKIVDNLEQLMKDGKITIEDIKADIVNWYDAKYVKKVVKDFKFSKEAEINGIKYSELIDAYVDIYKTIRDIFPKNRPTVNEMRKILDEAFNSFKTRDAFVSPRQVELNKLQALKGNWIGTSVEDLTKLKGRAKYLYNDKVLGNYLFNSFSQAARSVSLGGIAFKVIKGFENMLASLMYFGFYNIFGAGWSAGLQQVIQNEVHLMGQQMARDMANIDIEHLDDIMDLVNKINDFSILKATRPEFMKEVIDPDVVGGFRKVLGVIKNSTNSALRYVSTLTHADALSKKAVDKFSLVSALLDHGYSKDGVEELFRQVMKVSDDFAKKGYDKLLDFETVIKMNEKNLLEYLDTIFERNKIMDAATRSKIVEDMMNYKDTLGDLYKVLKDAEMKSMTFYQLSKSTGLHMNALLGKNGWMMFRFTSWSSKKAGEYIHIIHSALLRGDMKIVEIALKQLAAEAIISAKLYGIFDRVISGSTGGTDNIDPVSFIFSMYLPLVTLSMTSFGLLESFSREIFDPLELQQVKGTLISRIFSRFQENVLGISGRIGMPIAYWLGQYYRIYNGLKIVQKPGMEDQVAETYSEHTLKVLLELIKSTYLKRTSKYLFSRSNGVIMDDAISPVASLFAFANNAYLTKNQKLLSDIMDAGYDILRLGEEDISNESRRQRVIGNLFYKQIDYSYAYKALWSYYNNKGLGRFLRLGNKYNMAELFTELEQKVDNQKLEEFMKNNEWLSPDLEVEKMLKQGRLEGNTSTFNLVVSMLNPSQGNARQKGLWRIGAGVDEEAFQKYQADYKKIRKVVEEAIYEYVGNDIEKIKKFKIGSPEFQKFLKEKAEVFINKWGNAVVYKAVLESAVKIYRKLVRERLKLKYGNMRTAGYTEEYNRLVSNYEIHLISSNYNTILSLNQEIGPALQKFYMNNDEEYPLAKQITAGGNITKLFNNKIYSEITARQGLADKGIDTIYSYVLGKIVGSTVRQIRKLDKEGKTKQAQELGTRITKFMDGVLNQISRAYGPTIEQNVRAGFAANFVDYLKELVEFAPNLVKTMKKDFERWLDIVHVTTDVTAKDVLPELFEEPDKGKKGKGKKTRVRIPRAPRARLPKVHMRNLPDKLALGRDMNNAYRVAAGKLPRWYGPDYRLHGGSIRAIRTPKIKAKKPKIKLDFVKILRPTETRTLDLQVARQKKVKTITKYRPKKIKIAKEFRRVIK